ncbi:Nn.00g112090.m01.CDS01 [Neocucurbitaria sp. VM-36]
MNSTNQRDCGQNEALPNMTTPVAIVGMAFDFPDDARDGHSFWSMLLERRCASKVFPKDRLNGDALYHPDHSRGDSIPLRGGHFINEPLGSFDAPFFSISASEAVAMDPQSRSLLETTYRALENAGMPIETVSNSNTSVYTGNLADDFKFLCSHDVEQTSRHGMVGMTGLLSGRLSWFFNLKGPSLTVDTACSSSLVALDLGCQSLTTGSSSMSIVTGCSLLFSPNFFHLLSNMGMLSPDSKSFSFDHRANGYGRGEGIAALILKRLPDAIRDGDSIRAVIRSTSTNQDGHTPGVTQPNPISQAMLIRQTYARAGLSLLPTRYFEAHGTGTPVGDPIEASAIGEVFNKVRSVEDALYIGSVKSNIGHTEGASGLASVIKAILILERGVIPPNANFERLNPAIEAMGLNLKVPSVATPWPTSGLRRVSVNSFGASGTNAHAVLDDAYHYLREHSLFGNHFTIPCPPTCNELALPHNTAQIHGDESSDQGLYFPRILVLSAYDKMALRRLVDSYDEWTKGLVRYQDDFSRFIDNVSHTLAQRRSLFAHRSFVVIDNEYSLLDIKAKFSSAQRAAGRPRMAFVFTGQGAQWHGMARELLRIPRFYSTVREADAYVKKLGADWSVLDALNGTGDQSGLDRPLWSQTLCTVIQVALCDVFSFLGVEPAAVVGHSSGEIAAAYCIGAISRAGALKLAYFRGMVAEEVGKSSDGGMMAVGMSERDFRAIMDDMDLESKDLTVACINSPRSLTISGPSHQLKALAAILGLRNIFHRRLKVDVAYHSPGLKPASIDYKKSVGHLEAGSAVESSTCMISSVTGSEIDFTTLCHVDYWVENMLQPVRFSDAITRLISPGQSITFLLEIGPHCTLQGPIRDILQNQAMANPVAYHSALTRFELADKSFMTTLGYLWSHGLSVDLELANSIGRTSTSRPTVLADLPSYSFDRSCNYWPKGRLGKESRNRRHARLDLLGKPVLDWNPLQPRWSNVLKLSELPWAEDHKINGAIIYPAVGMLVMAIEAANQLADCSKPLIGIKLSDTHFHNALTIPTTPEGIETQLMLRPLSRNGDRHSSSWEFRLQSCKDGQWQEHCSGKVQLDYGSASQLEVHRPGEQDERVRNARLAHAQVEETAVCLKTKEEFYESAYKSGYTFGPSFRAMDEISYTSVTSSPQATATVQPFQWEAFNSRNHCQPHIVHPTTLDGILQISLVAFSRAGLDIVSTAVPTEIEYLWLSVSGLSHPRASSIKTRGTFINQGLVGYETAVVALDQAFENILLEAKGIKLRFVTGGSSTLNHPRQSNTCYALQWKPDPDLCERVSEADKTFEMPEEMTNLLARYVNLQTFKSPSMRILHLNSQKDSKVAVALQKIFETKDSNKLKLPSAIFVSKLFDTDQEKHQDSGVELSASDFDTYHLVILSGSSKWLLKALVCDIRRFVKDEGKLIIVPDHGVAKDDRFMKLSNSYVSVTDLASRQSSLMAASPTHREPMEHGSDKWGKILIDTGFIDSRMHIDNDGSIIATAIKGPKSYSPRAARTKLMIVHQGTNAQEELATMLQETFEKNGLNSETYRLQLLQAPKSDSQYTYVFLPELERPFLQRLSVDEFTTLRDTLSTAKGLLWLTARDKGASISAGCGMSDGLTRVLRAENRSAVIVTACLELDIAHTMVQDILKVVKATDFDSVDQVYESSYLKQNGELCIGRVVVSSDMSQGLLQRSLPYQSKMQAFAESPPLRLAIETPGLLDSICFEEDSIFEQSLGPNDIEIKVSHVGLNFKDLLLALGRENGKSFGNECAGIVSRAGSSTSFKAGDRVCAFSPTAFSTYTRVPDRSVARVPDEVSLEHAAAVPTQFVTAWHSLYNVANLQAGETILIHSAAGGTGQVAMQIAQMVGAHIFATVGTEEKRRFLMEHYNIAANHIYSSRDTDFALNILRQTGGRGIDVVLNSLSGESLLASWDIIAPYGRFIELGKKDILANSNLPMRPFIRRATFSAIETGVMSADYASHGRDMITHILGMLVEGRLQMVKNLQVLPISRLQEGMRMLQSGHNIGKIVFEMADLALIPTKIKTPCTKPFDPNRTYVIAGGNGGLGRAIAGWMVKEKGARNLLLLSRSGATSEDSKSTIRELRETGAVIESPICDICDKEALQSVLGRYQHMPRIGGCIQASMVLRDGLFSHMSYDDWCASTEPKTTGSWNLHTLLPKGMDFFVMLSSISGIIGSVGQANYAAGNTYMDALSHYRIAQGEKGTALDLGVIVDHGALAENPDLRSRILGQGFLAGIESSQIFDLLDICCDSTRTIEFKNAQTVLGIAAPSQIRASRMEQRHPFLSLPFYSHVFQHSSLDDGEICDTDTSREKLQRQFIAAASVEEAGIIISGALFKRLVMNSPMQDRNETDALCEPIRRFGVDSLLAIELRSWFLKEFSADLPIFEILGEGTLASIGLLAAEKSTLR